MKQSARPAVSRSWRAGDLMSRRFGIGLLIACVTAVVVPVLLVLGITGYFHRDMINSIYKNVEDIADATEMPPTVTSFQSGPEVVSTIGGSGEGLNCSLPGLANMFFDDIKNQGGRHGLVLQRFRQACVFHDLCYRHGLATYGYNQNDCDRILQNAALRLCNVWNPMRQKTLPDRIKNGSGGCQPGRLGRLSRLGPIDLFRVRVGSFALQQISGQPGGGSSLQVCRSATNTRTIRIRSF